MQDMNETRQPSRAVGIGCVIVGVALALICGLAETVGIGGGTFGWKQIVGVVAGCVIAIAGLTILLGPSSRSPTAP
jgi:predicted MFS family arabinose efflux permease